MNQVNRMWCVYAHVAPNGKMYIGITSQEPKSRWRNGSGYKYNQLFYRAIQKYGWNNIQHEIVASNLTEGEAKNFEILLISKLNTNDHKHGYNITSGGDGTVGVSHYGNDNSFYGKKHSQETREAMSNSHYDCRGENNPFYGRKHSDEVKKSLSDKAKLRTGEKNPNWGKKLSAERIEKIREQKSIAVSQFDLNMNFIKEYPSTKIAETETGVNHSLICRVCRGKLKTTHGYIWKYSCDIKEAG